MTSFSPTNSRSSASPPSAPWSWSEHPHRDTTSCSRANASTAPRSAGTSHETSRSTTRSPRAAAGGTVPFDRRLRSRQLSCLSFGIGSVVPRSASRAHRKQPRAGPKVIARKSEPPAGSRWSTAREGDVCRARTPVIAERDVWVRGRRTQRMTPRTLPDRNATRATGSRAGRSHAVCHQGQRRVEERSVDRGQLFGRQGDEDSPSVGAADLMSGRKPNLR
jgi:hypothetical protein